MRTRINTSKILTRKEIQTVAADLDKRSEGSNNTWTNLVIFRLSCCCGLRVSEICGVRLGDLVLDGSRPVLNVRGLNTQTKKHMREVPLWWDAGTLRDLQNWEEHRREEGAQDGDPFVCGRSQGVVLSAIGKPLDRFGAASRWTTALKVLGPTRRKQLSIHCGRHSFCSHTLAVGRSPIEVASAAGHSSTRMTLDTYGHLVERFDVPDAFDSDAA